MLIEGEHYIIKPFNEDNFNILLDAYLSSKEGGLPSDSLIDQCISAYLELKDSEIYSLEIDDMKKILEQNRITYVDARKYSDKKLNGEPIKAVRLFIGLHGTS